MWSLACIIFELLTGDLMFDPRQGEDYDRDEDHIAQFIELIGKVPKKVYQNGKYAKKYFTRDGSLKHISKLKFWPIEEVLREKYGFDQQDAEDAAAFLRPCLEFVPSRRATAAECLKSPWLTDPDPDLL